MKIFRRILFIILCIAIVVISIGFLLPRKIHVERRLLISGSQRTLFSKVNTLKNWVKWSPWLMMDTNAKVIFSGPESGVGASLRWISNDKNVVNGCISIVSSVSPDSIEVIYDFAEKGRSTGKFFFFKENKNTNVVISLESDLGMNPISRWIGLFSDQLIGPDLDKGLNKLDLFVQDTINVYGYEIADYEIPARIMISVRDTAGPATVTLKITDMYKKLSLFLKSKSISPIGNPVAIFHNYTNRNFDIEVGLPISSFVVVPDGLYCMEKGSQRVVMVKFSGPYKMIQSAYSAIQTYIGNNELEVYGPGWEEYITNRNIEADTNTSQTNIYYPVK
jgi:effector-binding domain-containing protein